jgi:glycosyltransferase involved in cell wall biosynthesis
MSKEVGSPKVSVCVITYNQENYIRQCLQSIIDQQTNFDFEVIVGDDCSIDGTRSIIKEFADRYTGIIKPIYQKENIGGGSNNFISVHRAAEGKYVAHVDGDDYCLPGKLQAQVDLLDGDPNCNIVFHGLSCLLPSGKIINNNEKNNETLAKMKFDRASILQFIAIGGHSSKMYRKKYGDFDIPNFNVTDFFANIEQVAEGYARFVGGKNLGVYRRGIGIATGGYESRKALAKSLIYFYKKYPKYRLEINTAAFTCLLRSLKSANKTWINFLITWLRTFHLLSIINFFLIRKEFNIFR